MNTLQNIPHLIAQAPEKANFGGGFQPVTNAYSKGSSAQYGFNATQNLENAISNFIGAFTLIAGLMFIFYFVYAGLIWLSAAGEKSKVQKARDQMTQAAIGLAVIVMSYGMIGLIGSVFGLDILRPGNTILNKLDPNKLPQSEQVVPVIPGAPAALGEPAG
jgi:amino acid transporter